MQDAIVPVRRSAPSVLFLAVCLCACAAPEPAADPDLGVTAVQFQDIVVPDGMVLIDRYHESHSREVAGWRYGQYVYAGGPSVADACAHLLLQMPRHSWQLASDQQLDEQTRKLRFERGRYVADYTVTRVDGDTRMAIDYRTEIQDKK